MALLNHPTSRFARRLLAALTVLSLTTPAAPAFALRGTIEAGAEEKVADALHAAAPSNVGLEEDVSRFEPPRILAGKNARTRDAQIVKAWVQGPHRRPGPAPTETLAFHRAGIEFLRNGQYENARLNFRMAASDWGVFLEAPPVREIVQPVLMARIAVEAGEQYTSARARASGPGTGMEYYTSIPESRSAYRLSGRAIGITHVSWETTANPWSRPRLALIVALGVDEEKAGVLVRNAIQVFTTKAAESSGKIESLRTEAGRLFPNQAMVFQRYDPTARLPENAVLLTATDDRPATLRKDVAAVNVNKIETFLNVIRLASQYQLNFPPTQGIEQIFGAAQVGNKTFIIFA